MRSVTKWLGTAVRGLRSFAYAADGQRPKVGVALGGGFARGIAHIGVLRVLEENEIPVDFIAGTSVGALIAATYASGTPSTRWRGKAAPLVSAISAAGRFRAWAWHPTSASNDFLHKFTTARNFSQMKIPLSIVATDLITGESVHFTDGEIGPALRASCAYPGLFLPVEHQDHFSWTDFSPKRSRRLPCANWAPTS